MAAAAAAWYLCARAMDDYRQLLFTFVHIHLSSMFRAGKAFGKMERAASSGQFWAIRARVCVFIRLPIESVTLKAATKLKKRKRIEAGVKPHRVSCFFTPFGATFHSYPGWWVVASEEKLLVTPTGTASAGDTHTPLPRPE